MFVVWTYDDWCVVAWKWVWWCGNSGGGSGNSGNASGGCSKIFYFGLTNCFFSWFPHFSVIDFAGIFFSNGGGNGDGDGNGGDSNSGYGHGGSE